MYRWIALILVAAASLAQATPIGYPAIARALVDTCDGCIFVLGTPFPAADVGEEVTGWDFYAYDGTVSDGHAIIGQSITPLLYSFDGLNYTITGIGTTQVITSLGYQTYGFGLVSGSDIVGANTYFGYRDGTPTSGNEGTIALDYNNGSDDSGSGPPWMLYFVPTNVSVGQNLGAPNGNLPRTYSVEADTSDVPEPGTLASLGIGALGILIGALRARKNR